MKSGNRKIPVFVLCSSEETAAEWKSRARDHAGTEIIPIAPVSQAWRVVKDIVAQYDASVVVCQEHVWFGAEFAQAVSALAAELSRRFPRWGACGNRGCVWEGVNAYDYTSYIRNKGSGLGAALAPRPVLTIDDNLVLLNCQTVRDASLCDLGDAGSNIFGLPLALECLRHGLGLFVDPRLFTVRTSQHSEGEIRAFTHSTEFRSYYRENFLNHVVPWPESAVDVKDCVDYDYAARPDRRASQRDLMDLFDWGLSAIRSRQPSVTLCCRTQFGRPELLRRALASFTAAKIEARGRLDLAVRLVTDCESKISEPQLADFDREFPALELACWHHTVREPRHSRADLIIGAIERAKSDYIWFVDDDDYVIPGAVQALARTLMPGDNLLVVADAWKVEETWETAENALAERRTVARFSNRNLFKVLTGANHIPVCSLLLPVPFIARRLADRKALGNYNEDYFVLLAALTAPQVEVRLLDATISAVSFRGADNTVNETNRAAWHYSYTTFMQEILCEADPNPLLWQLAKFACGSPLT